MSQQTPVPADERAAHAFEQRRRLLKLSASVAPVIATIPCGAALANASAHQCAVEAFNATNDQDSALGWVGGSDSYVRATVGRYLVTKQTNPNSGQQVYLFSLDGSNFYKEDGTLWSDPFNDYSPQAKVDDVYVMQVFQPIPNQVDPQGLVQQTPGWWPRNQLSTGTNMGVSASCLCSVNPNWQSIVDTKKCGP